MNVKHPDGKRTIVMVNDSSMMSEIEEYKSHDDADFFYVSIGGIGSSICALIDSDEWDAFVALINETDEIVQGLKKEQAK